MLYGPIVSLLTLMILLNPSQISHYSIICTNNIKYEFKESTNKLEGTSCYEGMKCQICQKKKK